MIPEMERSRIPDVAVATFHARHTRLFYCSTKQQGLDANATFEAASLSKPVFAAAVLNLVRQGRLNLDRPLVSYLNGPYEHRQNAFAPSTTDAVTDARISAVTARMVLSHTAGLPNWARNRSLEFIADPGQKWSYSGEAYVFLQTVVETIVGEPLDRFVERTIFVPFKMAHSSFVWRQEYEQTMLNGHDRSGSAHPAEHYAHAVASTTLYTTLSDYAKFLNAMLRSKSDSVLRMEEQKQVEVRPDIKVAWGLGLGIEDTARRSYFHWGSNPGFQSFFLLQPKTGEGILFLTDSDNGLEIVDAAVKAFVSGTHPALQFPMLHPAD